MPKKIDIGDLTADETKALAIECFSSMPWGDQIAVLREVFDADMRLEVAAMMEQEEE